MKTRIRIPHKQSDPNTTKKNLIRNRTRSPAWNGKVKSEFKISELNLKHPVNKPAEFLSETNWLRFVLKYVRLCMQHVLHFWISKRPVNIKSCCSAEVRTKSSYQHNFNSYKLGFEDPCGVYPDLTHDENKNVLS